MNFLEKHKKIITKPDVGSGGKNIQLHKYTDPDAAAELYRTLEKDLPFCRVASAQGLNMKADGLHFNASSCRVFGERYFEKWLELDQK